MTGAQGAGRVVRIEAQSGNWQWGRRSSIGQTGLAMHGVTRRQRCRQVEPEASRAVLAASTASAAAPAGQGPAVQDSVNPMTGLASGAGCNPVRVVPRPGGIDEDAPQNPDATVTAPVKRVLGCLRVRP